MTDHEQSVLWTPESMENMHGGSEHPPVWAPTAKQLRQIEQRARYERAKASRDAFRFVARKLTNLLTGERAAHKVRINGAA